MRIYTLGEHGIVTPGVIEALLSPRHHAQARVYIPARSKKTAAELATVCGVTASAYDPQLKAVAGPDWGSPDLFAAGCVYVVRYDGRDSPLVRLAPLGGLTVLGLVLPVPVTPRQHRHGQQPQRFYPLPAAGMPRPQLNPNEQAILTARGYADLWDQWDNPAAQTGGVR